MRRSIIAVSVMAALAVGVVGGVARADGPSTTNIVGTNNPDTLIGTSGADAIFGLRRADWIYGGKGRDVIYGNRGPDQIRAADGRADMVFGGPGKDGCVVDKQDFVRGCEHVVVLKVHHDDDPDD